MYVATSRSWYRELDHCAVGSAPTGFGTCDRPYRRQPAEPS
jgi:hypothetical protein